MREDEEYCPHGEVIYEYCPLCNDEISNWLAPLLTVYPLMESPILR
jgi:hypothetical protein